MKIHLIGESIHGVSEFTRYRHQWLLRHVDDQSIVVFEADHIGLLHSSQNYDDAETMLQNFPRVHRTREMANLLCDLLSRRIPIYGADVVARNTVATISGELERRRQKQQQDEARIYASPDCFAGRDEYMADVFAELVTRYPAHHFFGLFHNLHIKRHGSREVESLRLRSVAEQLRQKHRLPVHSTALFARQGDALHNNLTQFHFAIDDTDSIESLATTPTDPVILSSSADMGERVAYHHASERETLPVGLHYDACVVFPHATPPTLIPHLL